MANKASRTGRPGEGSAKTPCIAIAGGGTGGHVYPALAVAEELRRLGAPRLLWIGSRTGMERRIVEEAGIAFRGIPSGKLRRYFSWKNLTDALRVAAGVLSSLAILRRERPAVLFSKGGYVSVPPVLAAHWCRIPCFTHESDSDPGLATRINQRFVEKVLYSIPGTEDRFSPAVRAKLVLTGNPVRSDFMKADSREGRRLVGCPDGARMILFLGGSQGSAFLNDLAVAARRGLGSGYHLVHQYGQWPFTPQDGPGYFAAPFFRGEHPHVMAAADLVVSRAGANTLAELAVLGRPSILVPLPATSSRGDQIRNAELFRRAGAAVTFAQETLSAKALIEAIQDLFQQPETLPRMAAAVRGLGDAEAAGRIAAILMQRLGDVR